jgi:CBS-domain-containing membrane protein
MLPVTTLRPEDSAAELLRAFEDPVVRAAAVVSAEGRLLGLISEEDMLASCLPSYVLEDQALAKVLEEDVGSRLRERLEGKRVQQVVNTERRQTPPVSPEANLVEVATSLARSGDPAVLVAERGRVLGVITVDVLLPALLGPPSA